ncbi:MAG: efflux RND transporter periplasmic adaptor subunit [Gammaproteobacteria bacterium]|nr:efflux RND transporter periplasmic adaptor subunit [Gammaproteobacteria bacterium]
MPTNNQRLQKVPRLFSFIGLIVVFLSACSSDMESGASGPSMPPASVSVLEMKPHDVPFVIELPATLSGSKEVEIRARVSGILESRNFQEGDRIEKGQSLFTLELTPFELEVERAKADKQSAKARVDQAKREVARLKKLRAEKSVSQRDYDNSQSALEISEADFLAAQARLREAELNLDYAKVVSPVAGIVGREFVSEGTFIPGPEVLLTEMTQLDPIRVRFGLSEREQLQMRQDVESGKLKLPENGHWNTRIKLPDGTFYNQLGKVNFSDVRINPNTGTSEYQAIVANSEYQLRPGQFVRVLLEGGIRQNSFVVPQRAVLDSGTGKYVYLLATNENGQTIAQPAPVEVGEWVRGDKVDNTEITNGWVIHKGLNSGDKVIVDGVAKIFFPGAPVSLASGQANASTKDDSSQQSATDKQQTTSADSSASQQ